jgi:hypothetical protein
MARSRALSPVQPLLFSVIGWLAALIVAVLLTGLLWSWKLAVAVGAALVILQATLHVLTHARIRRSQGELRAPRR